MDTFECIRRRHSYRGAYLDTPVPRDDLRRIMEAGLAAPSGCHKQTTYLAGIDDPALLDSVTALVKKSGFGGTRAPAGICVFTHEIPAYGNCFFNVQDYSAAIENLLLAVTALGYASCWIEGQVTGDPEHRSRISELLNAPAEYAPVAFLPVGIPAVEVTGPEYRPFGERAWFNVWGG